MVEQEKKNLMEYRYLGNTGLKVSVLSFGNMVNILQPNKQQNMDESVKKCLEYGINYFDTAELYGFGDAEILLGNSLKTLNAKREDVVISTKLFYGTGDNSGVGEHLAYYMDKGINSVGLSRKHIIEGTKASLKRLQLDYVDIIFGHRPDYQTPLEETCRAFSWVIDQGLAMYWGTSEWDAEMIIEAIQLCRRLGLHEPIAE